MSKFDLGDLRLWREVSCDDERPIDGGGGRNIRLRFIATDTVAIMALDEKSGVNVPLAVGDGMIEIQCRIVGPWRIWVEMAKDTILFAYDPDYNQLVEAVHSEKLTSIERRRERNPAFEKMMMEVKFNEQRRSERLEAELGRMREALANAQLVTPAPAKSVSKSSGKKTSG